MAKMSNWDGKNPKQYIDAMRKDKPLFPKRFDHSYQETKEILEKMTRFEIPWPEPVHWLSGDWEEHKRLCLEEAKRTEYAVTVANKLIEKPFLDALRDMPETKYGRPCSFSDVSFAEHQLGVHFASDYVDFLLQYDSFSMWDINLASLDGKDTILELGKEFYEIFPGRKQYYPLCCIDSERTTVVVYVQDKNGYVYSVLDDKSMEPMYFSLHEFMVSLWYMKAKGWL